MLQKPTCEQLTLVQSDISPIDISSVIVIKRNFYPVGVSKKKGLRRKSKVCPL